MRRLRPLCILPVLAALAAGSAHAASIWYVDKDATGTGFGLDWTDAFTSLPPALAAARPGDQIWIAEGTYVVPAGDDAFILPAGVALRGGFQGIEGFAEGRDIEGNPTILSGDLNEDDLASPARSANDIVPPNASHVVIVDGSGDTLIEGLTITGGSAVSPPAPVGGGIIASDSEYYLTVRFCRVQGNNAQLAGGGIYVSTAGLFLDRCTFVGNNAIAGGTMFAQNLTAVGCLFAGNTAQNAAVCTIDDQSSTHHFWNCAFVGNYSLATPALVLVDAPSVIPLQMLNCTFASNTTVGEEQRSLVRYVNQRLDANTGDPNSVIFRNNLVEEPQDGMEAVIAAGAVPGTYIEYGVTRINSTPYAFLDLDGPDDQLGTADDSVALDHRCAAIDAALVADLPPDPFDYDNDANTTEAVPIDIYGVPREIDFIVRPAVCDVLAGTLIPDVGAAEFYQPDLTAVVTRVAMPPGTPMAVWTLAFNAVVVPDLSESNFALTGSLAGNATPLFSRSGSVVTFAALINPHNAAGTIGFDIIAPLTGDDEKVMRTNRSIAPESLDYFPPGDVNQDGTFDIADVILLANANVGLAVLP